MLFMSFSLYRKNSRVVSTTNEMMPSAILSPQQDGNYKLCISNEDSGVSCSSIPGYSGPEIKLKFGDLDEVDVEISSCENADKLSCGEESQIKIIVQQGKYKH